MAVTRPLVVGFLLGARVLYSPHELNAQTTTSHSASVACDEAALQASRDTGVPFDILRAITRTETGRDRQGSFVPWPWTVNFAGEGHWFGSRSEALNYLESHPNADEKSFDVGCFQLNFRWHGDNFLSLEEMFDPFSNADYAAKFLTELFSEFGSWSAAISAYHSRTPKHGRRYVGVVRRHYTKLSDHSNFEIALPPQQARNVLRTPRPISNVYPLITKTLAPKSRASLVPLDKDPLFGRLIEARSSRVPG